MVRCGPRRRSTAFGAPTHIEADLGRSEDADVPEPVASKSGRQRWRSPAVADRADPTAARGTQSVSGIAKSQRIAALISCAWCENFRYRRDIGLAARRWALQDSSFAHLRRC
jgi:hypothetical protein